MKLLQRTIIYLFFGLVLLLPFHALILNQFNLSQAQELVAGSWKETIIGLMSVLAVVVAVGNKQLRRQLTKPRPLSILVWLIVAFGLLNLAYVVWFSNTPKAELVGLRTNLAFLAVFVAVAIGSWGMEAKVLQQQLTRIIVGVATVVAAFALLQSLAPTWTARYLPNNDYSLSPFLFVQDGGLLRVNSSLWGPSQLASFLVLPIALTLWQRLKQPRWAWTAALGLMLIALYATQSRAAWAATALAIAIVLAWQWRQHLTKRLVVWLVAGMFVLVPLIGLVAAKTNSPLSYLVFHSNSQQALTESSNSDRATAIQEGIATFTEQPLGTGPGSAGPASTYNQVVIYPESYYVQLLIELGVIGLGLFLAISGLSLWQVWQLRAQAPAAVPLTAAMVGLLLMNVVHHTWSDAATAVTWWGSAGLLLGGAKK